MLIKDISPGFAQWAFGESYSDIMVYYDLVKSWNKLHGGLMVFPATWNLENEQCFLRTIYSMHMRWLKYKQKGINDSAFEELNG